MYLVDNFFLEHLKISRNTSQNSPVKITVRLKFIENGTLHEKSLT